MNRIKALVLTGYGINCDCETAEAFRLADAEPAVIHINDVMNRHFSIHDYQVIAFPGGFSYGDDLGSGLAMANKIRHGRTEKGSLVEEIIQFVYDGKIVIGICNGFQVLVKSGLLPNPKNRLHPSASLIANDSNAFESRWVDLDVPQNICPAMKGIDSISLPVRHGEGKFVVKSEAIMDALKDRAQIIAQYADESGPTMEYPGNPNGSQDAVAGICDDTGRIIGLMPHPEAFLSFYNHPHWTRLKALQKISSEEGDGLKIFRNIVRWLEDNG